MTIIILWTQTLSDAFVWCSVVAVQAPWGITGLKHLQLDNDCIYFPAEFPKCISVHRRPATSLVSTLCFAKLHPHDPTADDASTPQLVIVSLESMSALEAQQTDLSKLAQAVHWMWQQVNTKDKRLVLQYGCSGCRGGPRGSREGPLWNLTGQLGLPYKATYTYNECWAWHIRDVVVDAQSINKDSVPDALDTWLRATVQRLAGSWLVMPMMCSSSGGL